MAPFQASSVRGMLCIDPLQMECRCFGTRVEQYILIERLPELRVYKFSAPVQLQSWSPRAGHGVGVLA